MMDYLGCNLTEYKSFRQLQLEYTKIKDQNQTLRSQLDSLTAQFHKKCEDLIEQKRQNLQEKIKIKNKNLKYKKLYRQLIQHIQTNLSCLTTNQIPSQQSLNTSINDKSIFVHLEETQNLQKICNKLSTMTKQFLSLKDKNLQLTKKIQLHQTQQKSQSLENKKNQQIIHHQISTISRNLQQLQAVNNQLQAKLNLKEKEKKKYQSQLKHLRNECKQLQKKVNHLLKEKQERNQEDPEFALDFMTFQLQTLQSFFTRMTESTKYSNQISNIMMIIYADYEEISQVFREKLQIQYDLQQLEQRYKSQKVCPQADQTLLIQTRRQIQTFRLQLLKQKQIFRQKQHFIEEHFEEYAQLNQTQMKIKNYAYQVENRLYQNKKSQIETYQRNTTRIPTARDILNKRQQNQKIKDFIPQNEDQQYVDKEEYEPIKKTSLRFKQSSNAQEIMKEIIKKDKNNLQKLLKQTRKSSIPVYLGK